MSAVKEVKKNRSDKGKLVSQLILLAVLLALDEILVRVGVINSLFLSSPSQIVEAAVKFVKDGTIWGDLFYTLAEFLLGFIVSAFLGILLGTLFFLKPRLHEILDPFIVAVFAIPKVAIMPLLIIWFGIGFGSKVIMVFLFSFFNIFFSTIDGMRQTNENHLKLMKIFRASKKDVIFKVLLPSAIPSIFTSLRVTCALGITGVIFSEMQASEKGLGNLLSKASALYQTPKIFTIIIIVTLISIFSVKIVNIFEKKVFMRWKYRK